MVKHKKSLVMEQKQQKSSNLKVPIILGSIAILFGVFGFLFEKTGWPGFLSWLSSSEQVQGILKRVAAFEHSLYQTFQFAQFEYEPGNYGDVFMNPFLFIARWLLPVAIIWTAIYAYFRLRREEYKIKNIRKWKDHTILCGYGEIGKRVAKSLIDDKKKIVVIDPQIEKDHFYTDDQKHCILIRQDANINNSLFRAGIKNASVLIAVTGSDIQNFGILSNAKTLMRGIKTDRCLSAFAHVDNHDLMQIVQDYPLFQTTEKHFDGRVFNADEIAARLVFREHAPDIYQPVVDIDTPPLHVMIVGFNKFAQLLVTQFGLSAHFLHNAKTQVTVIDQKAGQLGENYLDRHEMINEAIDLEFVACKTECFNQKHVDAFKNTQPVSVIYMCLDDITLQTLTLNTIRDIYKYSVHTVVCQPAHIPVPEWVKPENKFYLFDPFTLACNYQTIIEERIEKIAERFHEVFLEKETITFNEKMHQYKESINKGEQIDVPEKKPSMVHWQALNEEFKQSNRSLAAHLDVKLRAIGCEACDMNNERPEESFPQDEDTINKLANMEHRRWNAHKFLTGWKSGEKRNEVLKINENLVVWDKLPQDIKDYDIVFIKKIPEILKRKEFNLKICKLNSKR